MGQLATVGCGVCHGGVQWEAELCACRSTISAQMELLQFHDHTRLDATLRIELRQLSSDTIAIRRVYVLSGGAQDCRGAAEDGHSGHMRAHGKLSTHRHTHTELTSCQPFDQKKEMDFEFECQFAYITNDGEQQQQQQTTSEGSGRAGDGGGGGGVEANEAKRLKQE